MSFVKKSDWEILLKEKAEILCKKTGEICNDESSFVTTDTDIDSYIGSINGSERFGNLSATSIGNINSGFGWYEKYGDKISFIDTGVLFKKGKSGVLFCRNGIIIKPVMGSGTTTVDFHTMCSSIVEDSGYYIVAENKFMVKEESGISVVDATSVMLNRFVKIREILLSQSEEHRKCFCETAEKLVGNTYDKVSEGSYDEAASKAKLLYRFCKDTISELFATAAAVRSVIYALNNDFENAKTYAMESLDEELESFINEKAEEYEFVLAGELYENAKAEYEQGEYFRSMKLANDSIHKLATAENWQLYFDSLYMSASEKNQFNHVLLDVFKSHTTDKSEAKTEIINKESARIAELEKKYKEYISILSDRIPEKVREEDINFFNENPDFITVTDKYGMNAVMYAVLFGKKDLYDEIKEKYPLNTKTNVLGHTINDIAVFGSTDDGDELLRAVWFKYHKSFKEKYEKYCNDLKWAERKEKFADFSSSVADSAYRSAMNSGNYSGASQTIDVSASAASVKKEARESISEIKADFYKYFEELYNKTKLRVADTALTFAQKEFLEVKEKPKAPELSEVENKSEFISLLNIEKNKFIESYVTQNLTPKGEFEKTVQYEERKAKIHEDAAKEFESKKDTYKKSCYSAYLAKLGETTVSAENVNLKIELAKIYFKSLFDGKVSLDAYDADEEVFKITYESYSSDIAIPIDVAADFKNCYSESGLDYSIEDIVVKSNKLGCSIKFICSAKFKDTSFPFTFMVKSK